jgi:ligand-binding sensor domain-containing protein
MFRAFLTILLQALITFSLFSQKLKFEQLSSRHGLPSDEVFNLHMDKSGYLWCFTNYGVVKYNSKEFRPALRNLPFNESFIYSCYEDRRGRMWVANSNGKIYNVRNDSAFEVKEISKTSEVLRKRVQEVYQLYVDDSLNIFAITKHYSYKFIRSRNYEALNLSTVMPDSLTYMIFKKGNTYLPVLNFSGNDTIYCGGLKELYVHFQDRAGVLKLQCKTSNLRHVKGFGSKIFFSHHDRLHCIGDKYSREIQLNSIILNFTQDQNKHLWAACYNDGVYELDENDSIVNHYFSNITVNDVHTDFQNGLWISTSGSGLYHCKNINDKYFTEETSLGESINYLKEMDNNLFVGTVKGEIFLVDSNHKAIVWHKESGFEAFDILKLNNQHVASFRYIVKSVPINNLIGKLPASISNSFTALRMVKRSEDTLLFLSRRYITVIVNGKQYRTIPFNFKAYDLEKTGNSILIATDDGVKELTGDKVSEPAYLKVLNNISVSEISTDPSGSRFGYVFPGLAEKASLFFIT